MSVCYHKIAVNFNFSKSKQATSHKLSNPAETKSGSLQDRQGKIWKQDKLTVQILYEGLLKGTILLGISTEMLVSSFPKSPDFKVREGRVSLGSKFVVM